MLTGKVSLWSSATGATPEMFPYLSPKRRPQTLFFGSPGRRAAGATEGSVSDDKSLKRLVAEFQGHR